MYRVSKGRERMTKNLNQVESVIDEEGKIFVEEKIQKIDGTNIYIIYLVKNTTLGENTGEKGLERRIELTLS